MFIFSFYSKLICRFRMSNQTLVHNMRCQNQLQWGELEIIKKKGIATSHTSRVHTVFTQNGGESV